MQILTDWQRILVAVYFVLPPSIAFVVLLDAYRRLFRTQNTLNRLKMIWHLVAMLLTCVSSVSILVVFKYRSSFHNFRYVDTCLLSSCIILATSEFPLLLFIFQIMRQSKHIQQEQEDYDCYSPSVLTESNYDYTSQVSINSPQFKDSERPNEPTYS